MKNSSTGSFALRNTHVLSAWGITLVLCAVAAADLPVFTATEVVPRPEPQGAFATSLAIGGDRLVVGAPFNLNCNNGTSQGGGAYIFERIDGEWVQLADSVGWCNWQAAAHVDISADGAVFIVGNAAGGADASGFARIYRITDGQINEDFVIGGHAFVGVDVALDPDGTAAIFGNPSQGDGTNGGKVHIYRYDSGTWNEEQIIGHPTNVNFFGGPVDMHADRIVVGAGANNGSLWLYEYNGVSWASAQQLQPTPTNGGVFTVDLEGDTLVVGQSENNAPVFAAGRIWIYERNARSGEFELVFDEPGDGENSRLGSSVAIDGDTVVAGARVENASKGAVYVYRRDNGVWSRFTKLGTVTPPNVTQNSLGTSVAVQGDVILGGAPGTGSGASNAVFIEYSAPTPLCDYFADFEGDDLPEGLLTTGACSIEYVEDGVLVATQPQGCPNSAAFETDLGLILDGDFDVYVEWETDGIPPVLCGWDVALGLVALRLDRSVLAGNQIVQRCLPGGCVPGGGTRAYHAWDYISGSNWCNGSMVGTSDFLGAFRIVREGETITSYYRNNSNGEWVSYRTATVPVEPVTFLVRHNHPTQGLTAYYDNFSISCEEPCVGDFDGDGAVGVSDLLAMLNSWGACEAPCLPDIAPLGPPQGDGAVNVSDLLLLLGLWGECP